jgi:hypothetical protein
MKEKPPIEDRAMNGAPLCPFDRAEIKRRRRRPFYQGLKTYCNPVTNSISFFSTPGTGLLW